VTPRAIAPVPRLLLPAGRLTRAALFAFGATVAGCGARTGSDPGEPGPEERADAGAVVDSGRPDRPDRDGAVPPVGRDAGLPPAILDAGGEDGGGAIALYGTPPAPIGDGGEVDAAVGNLYGAPPPLGDGGEGDAGLDATTIAPHYGGAAG
jgi:hypothetical protein